MAIEDTRNRLLKTALELFSKNGYMRTTTKLIAKHAEVSELTLFRHFNTKEHLFDCVLEKYCFKSELININPKLEELPIENALYEVGVALILHLKKEKNFITILVKELNMYPHKIRDIHNKHIDYTIEQLGLHLKDRAEQGKFRDDLDFIIVARKFLGSLYSTFLVLEIFDDGVFDEILIDNHVKSLVDIFLYGMVKR